MKSFRDYLAESEAEFDCPGLGDDFAIVIREECLIESYVIETRDDGVVIQGDDRLISLLEQYGYEMETIRRYGAVGSSPGQGYTVAEEEIKETDHTSDQELRLIRGRAGLEETAPNANRNDPLAAKAADDAAVSPMEEDGVDPVNAQGQDAEDLHGQATSSTIGDVDEAKYQGREVKLGKPMAGDVKKSKVYVKNPAGNVVKVNFGDPNMRIKKSNPERRKSFRARHNCDNPGPRHKARYWSCRAW
jgi:hypothetical protein